MATKPSFADRPGTLQVPQSVIIGPLRIDMSEEFEGWRRLDIATPEEHAVYLRKLGVTGLDLERFSDFFVVTQNGDGERQYVDAGFADFGTAIGPAWLIAEGLPEPSTLPEESRVYYAPDISDLEAIVDDDPRYQAAIEMVPDELWAKKDNEGRSTSSLYIRAHSKVRHNIVRALHDGSLYSHDYDSFCDVLKTQHAFLVKSGTHGRQFHEHEIGQFSPDSHLRRVNNRLKQSIEIARIASQYGDPYGQDGRFERGKPYGVSVSAVALPGIDYTNWPEDTVFYDGHGELPTSYDSNRYRFLYPPTDAIGQYLHQVWRLGAQIERGIKEGSDKAMLLDLIARQYQYAANARPFENINNSLFMHLVNIQVKLLGYGGMTHAEMDIAAQRMQPDAFARYFADRATGNRE